MDVRERKLKIEKEKKTRSFQKVFRLKVSVQYHKSFKFYFCYSDICKYIVVEHYISDKRLEVSQKTGALRKKLVGVFRKLFRQKISV